MVEKIFMSVKQKCDNALIMLFYKFIDGSKIIDEFGNVFRWSDFKGFKFLQKRICLLEMHLIMIDEIFFLRCGDYPAIKAII